MTQPSTFGPATLVIFAGLTLLGRVASAQYLPVFGGPSYDARTGVGYRDTLGAYPYGKPLNNIAHAVSWVGKYDPVYRGNVSLLWNASGGVIELANLGSAYNGISLTSAISINNSDEAVGEADKYVSGNWVGNRAVRWDSNGVVTELGTLEEVNSFQQSAAYRVNEAGEAVGAATRFSVKNAVRWDRDGRVLELARLDADSHVRRSEAYDLNNSGQAVGYAGKYAFGNSLGYRAVRWDTTGVAHEMGNLGTSVSGFTYAAAWDINESRQSVGYAERFVAGNDKGTRAVRWGPTGVATELANLGTDESGNTSAVAYRVNESGQAVGQAQKYVLGSDKGSRAVMWDTSGAAVELGNLGTSNNGSTSTVAEDVNDWGQTVGSAGRYVSDIFVDQRAVLWKPDGTVIDLNSLIGNSSGWFLKTANAISNTGWITGVGSFDPDGPGPLASYDRFFLLQVPEPASLVLLALGANLLKARNQSSSDRKRRRCVGSPFGIGLSAGL